MDKLPQAPDLQVEVSTDEASGSGPADRQRSASDRIADDDLVDIPVDDFEDLDNVVADGRPKDKSSSSSLSGSDCSSPLPSQPYKAAYVVKLLSNVVDKDGDQIHYTIKSKRQSDHLEFVVRRQYEDFEYLSHQLVTSQMATNGLIIPPLPLRLTPTAEMVEGKSREQLGSNTRSLIADDFFFQKDCWQLQEYLRLNLCHPVFGCSSAWDKFLTHRDPSVRVKVKKSSGLMTRLHNTIDQKYKADFRDFDDFFHKERHWANHYAYYLTDLSDVFKIAICSRHKLCGVLGHLSAALNLNLGDNQSHLNRMGMKYCNLFSQGLDDYKVGLEVMNYNDESSLACFLELWTKYIEAEKEMLFQRTCLLIDYQSANKSLDKAKANKRETAEQTKMEAEKAFDDCSDVAREEIKRFHRERVKSFGSALRKFAEARLLVARDMYEVTKNSVDKLKNFQF